MDGLKKVLGSAAKGHVLALVGGFGLGAMARLTLTALPLFDGVHLRGPFGRLQSDWKRDKDFPLDTDEESLKRLVRRLLHDPDLGPVVETLLREVCAEMGWDPEEVMQQL